MKLCVIFGFMRKVQLIFIYEIFGEDALPVMKNV